MTRSYWFLIGLLAAIWGASYLFIKVAVRDFSPPAMMELRLAFAALAARRRSSSRAAASAKRSRDVRAAGWHGLAIGVVNGAIPFTLIAWGEKYIDSGVAAIANSTVPIFNVMLAPLMLPSERTTGVRLFGFVLGLVGVGVLSGAQPTVTTAVRARDAGRRRSRPCRTRSRASTRRSGSRPRRGRRSRPRR